MTKRMGRQVLAILIILLAFSLRMIRLQGRALWYDEAFAVLYAALEPEGIIHGTVTPVEGAGAADVHPLFYYFLLHGWMVGVGRSPLAVRFLSVILGMITVVLLWRLAAWCFDRRTGLAVGLLAAANPFHVAYSQEARMYGLLGLAAVAAVWGLLRALGIGEQAGGRAEGRSREPVNHLQSATHDSRSTIRHNPHWWVLYAVFAALTLYAHNLGAFVLLALHLLVLMRRQWRCQWRRWLLPLALADLLALLLFSPWLIGVLPGQIGFVGRGYWLESPGVAEVVRTLMFPVLTFYEAPPFWLVAVGISTGLLLLALLLLRLRHTRSRAGWFLLLCWAPVGSLLLLSFWRPIYLERALLPSALFYLAAVGWLFAQGRLPVVLHWGLVVLLLVSIVGSLETHYTFSRFPRPPFEELNALIKAQISEGEIVVHDNKLTFFPAYYYDPDLAQEFCPDLYAGSDTLAWPTQEALGLFAKPISETMTGEVVGVWYVVFDRTWQEYSALGLDDVPNRAWLRAHCHQEGEVQTIADLEIYHFVDCETGR